MPAHVKVWTFPEVQELKRLFHEGKTDTTIGRRLGRSRTSVELKRWRLGLKHYAQNDPARDELVRRLCHEGWYDHEIGDRLGISRYRVRAIRRRLGVTAGRFTSDGYVGTASRGREQRSA